jgi:hypothetical protein
MLSSVKLIEMLLTLLFGVSGKEIVVEMISTGICLVVIDDGIVVLPMKI